ncbi:Zn-dependent exopeptidase [Mollisia scopiformis]|uniref:Zn-dependent exopeptidase n=1 Tax=Mollisia scopiformis TaxID=149040 RepID=A0A194XQE7_MOLSC|nr:Zn-dependent exopeptidase [Mollisia scopiformis]KUJ22386.1 Zn-dependent exopeptidase [Mollisia scopiformis]
MVLIILPSEYSLGLCRAIAKGGVTNSRYQKDKLQLSSTTTTTPKKLNLLDGEMKIYLLSTFLLASWAHAALSIGAQEPIINPTSSSLLELHKSLIEHESITGNEHNVAKYLISYLKSKNFTVETQDVGPFEGSNKPRENILAYVGKQRKTRTLVSSHIDTVPPYWEYKSIGDEIWGRGSVDAKGSVATQIIAVEQLLAAGKIAEGDVALLFVVGEERGGDGMKKANDLGMEWEACIFGEPTELKLASGHKGIMSVDLKAKGKAGHSGYPELGRSANSMLIPALNALLNMELPWSEKYGNTTLNIGRIEGGVAPNVIAEEASANIAIRIADGEPVVIEKIILDTLEAVGQKVDVSFGGGYGPVYIDSDVPGFEKIVVNYGTDIPNLKGDHKRYLYGPGSILMAHSDHEHLTVHDLEAAVKGYKTLIEYALK